jgi:aminopeptidase N
MWEPDRRQRFELIAPALSGEQAERDLLFARLIRDHGRSLWSVAAVDLLNHPLRSAGALHYLRAGIAHAARIQAQGEPFWPRQWLNALLRGHTSAEAAAVVSACLEDPAMPARFKRLLLETSDLLFRAVRIRDGR